MKNTLILLDSYILVEVKTYVRLGKDVWKFIGRVDILTEGFIEEVTLGLDHDESVRTT